MTLMESQETLTQAPEAGTTSPPPTAATGPPSGGAPPPAQPPSSPSPDEKPSSLQRLKNLLVQKKVLIPLVIVVILVLGGGATIALKGHGKKSGNSAGQSSSDNGELQDVSSADLKKFSDAFLTPSTNQTATFNANAIFRNNLTVEKTLTAGAIKTSNLNISGAVSLDSVNVGSNLFVNGGSTLQGNIEARGQLTVRGALTATNASFSGNLAVSGTLTAGSLAVSDLSVHNLTVSGTLSFGGHLNPTGSTPGVSRGSASGGGSASINGTDTSGTVNIHTGGGPSSGPLVTVSFRSPFNGVPRVIITPVTPEGGKLQYYVAQTANSFTIQAANTPGADSDLTFNYWVTQ